MLHITQSKAEQLLLYTFVSNGRFYSDREKLRLAIALPGETYTYFSKIEVVGVIPIGQDDRQVYERCRKLLDEVLPILLEEHYPRDADLRPGA